MKTITIRDDTYHTLLMLKEGEDSFSDVINRLISKRTGTYGNMPERYGIQKYWIACKNPPGISVIPGGRDGDRS